MNDTRTADTPTNGAHQPGRQDAKRPPAGSAALLNVTRLRQELERLERHGAGEWSIDVVPSLNTPDGPDGRPDLAFDMRSYGVAKLNAMGTGNPDDEPFVSLYFAPRVPDAG